MWIKWGKECGLCDMWQKKNISFVENSDVIFKDYDILVQGSTYKPYQFVRLLRNTEDGAKGKSIIEENEKLLNVAYQSLLFEETLVATEE